MEHSAPAATPVLVAGLGGAGDGTGGLHRVLLGAGGRAPAGERVGADDLSCVVLHPQHPVAYGTAERTPGQVRSWTTGSRLAALGTLPSGGDGPCHLAVHPGGKVLLAVNYTSGTVAAVRLAQDGRLERLGDVVQLRGGGPVRERQGSSHPHQAVLAAGGELVLVPDLGADLLRTLAVDARTASLREVATSPLPPGTGPRHAVLITGDNADDRAAESAADRADDRAGDTLVVTGELAQTVLAGRFDERTGSVAAWSPAPSTRRAGADPNHPGDVVALPGSDVVVAANRGADTLAVLRVRDHVPQLLDEVSPGVRWPQHLAVLGDRLLVAGRDSGAVVALAIERATGSLGPPTTVADVPSPVWLAPVPR